MSRRLSPGCGARPRGAAHRHPNLSPLARLLARRISRTPVVLTSTTPDVISDPSDVNTELAFCYFIAAPPAPRVR